MDGEVNLIDVKDSTTLVDETQYYDEKGIDGSLRTQLQDFRHIQLK